VACALLALSACACSSSGSVPAPDASLPDAYSPLPDAGELDTGSLIDAFVPPADAGSPDATDAATTDAADAADAADASADAAACPWAGSYESPACTVCLRSACCGAAMTCETDPSCVTLDQCVDACIANGGADAGDGGDGGSISTCAQSCFDSQSAAVRSEWQALSNCLEFQCGNSGAGPCQ
jgi:hypothetical protein